MLRRACAYLCDDTWSDLYRLDGRRLGHQRNRALHSHRVTHRLVGVGRETCEKKRRINKDKPHPTHNGRGLSGSPIKSNIRHSVHKLLNQTH